MKKMTIIWERENASWDYILSALIHRALRKTLEREGNIFTPDGIWEASYKVEDQ